MKLLTVRLLLYWSAIAGMKCFRRPQSRQLFLVAGQLDYFILIHDLLFLPISTIESGVS